MVRAEQNVIYQSWVTQNNSIIKLSLMMINIIIIIIITIFIIIIIVKTMAAVRSFEELAVQKGRYSIIKDA